MNNYFMFFGFIIVLILFGWAVWYQFFIPIVSLLEDIFGIQSKTAKIIIGIPLAIIAVILVGIGSYYFYQPK